jgi:hypothetical protein
MEKLGTARNLPRSMTSAALSPSGFYSHSLLCVDHTLSTCLTYGYRNMSRRCKVCTLNSEIRLTAEKLAKSHEVQVKALSQWLHVSRVALWRHCKNHTRYPLDWPDWLIRIVLASARKSRVHLLDQFQPWNWAGWKEYVNAVARAERKGYDFGYFLTFLVLFNKSWFQKQLPEEYQKLPDELALDRFKTWVNITLMNWKQQRRPDSVRYRVTVSYDGRSTCRRYLA